MPEPKIDLRSAAATAVERAPQPARSFLLRSSRWLERQIEPPTPVPAPAAPPAAPTFVTSLPLPIPEGWTEAELRQVFSTWSIDGEPPGHMDAYVADSFERFVHTYGLVADEQGVCLELGANPYFTTFLLDECSPLELELANFFDGTKDEITQPLSWTDRDGTVRTREYRSKLFNIEDERFPYEDESLDVVLFCEILEHLLMDPVSVLAEIHRILKPGGLLVVTTPNVCRLENALRMIEGQNIYDPYSGYGPYGRHNREYTHAEVDFLLEFAGFEVERSFCADGHPTAHQHQPGYDGVAPLLVGRDAELGAYTFTRSRKVRPPREGLPDRLYRSYPPERLVGG